MSAERQEWESLRTSLSLMNIYFKTQQGRELWCKTIAYEANLSESIIRDTFQENPKA